MKLNTDWTKRIEQLRQWVDEIPDPDYYLDHTEEMIDDLALSLSDDHAHATAWLHQSWEPEQYTLDDADRRFLREEIARQYGKGE